MRATGLFLSLDRPAIGRPARRATLPAGGHRVQRVDTGHRQCLPQDEQQHAWHQLLRRHREVRSDREQYRIVGTSQQPQDQQVRDKFWIFSLFFNDLLIF